MPSVVTHHRIVTRGFGPDPPQQIDDGPGGVVGSSTLASGPVTRGFGSVFRYLILKPRRPRGRRPPSGQEEFLECIMIAAKLVPPPWVDALAWDPEERPDAPRVEGSVYAELDRRHAPRVSARALDGEDAAVEGFEPSSRSDRVRVVAERVLKKRDT